MRLQRNSGNNSGEISAAYYNNLQWPQNFRDNAPTKYNSLVNLYHAHSSEEVPCIYPFPQETRLSA